MRPGDFIKTTRPGGTRGRVLVLIVLGLAWTNVRAFDRSEGKADTLRILFTAETRGNLVPCACPRNPLGGLARRVAYLKPAESETENRGAVLRLDAGGFLPEGEVALRDRPEVAARYVSLLLDAMEAENIEATITDNREREFLRRTARRACDALAPRLLEADPPGPARVVSRGGHRVALLALEETLADSVAARAASEARRKGDLLIVLARADAGTGRRLARLSRADLVILSRGARTEGVLYEAGVPLVGCGGFGREVGSLRLLPSSRGTPSRVEDFRLTPMDASRPEDAVFVRRVAALTDDETAAQVLRVRAE